MPEAPGDTVETDAPSVKKGFEEGTDRTVPPAVTLVRARELMRPLGITRIADVTGLDRIGVPVVTVCRPNSRSLSVSQGKGLTLEAAQASGLMESIECFHAEHVTAPLLLGSYSDLRATRRMAQVAGLPRLAGSAFHDDLPLLWMAGVDMVSGEQILAPYEAVHLDLRLPLPTGSGAFLMSSNGLASGNHLLEAISHAVCELVERDANTLWHVGGGRTRASRRVSLASVDDRPCRTVLDRFEDAGIAVAIWETTSDVGIPGFLATIVEREGTGERPMSPVSGSGCHPRRGVALLRALTEAAQGRLTIISGARDDLTANRFEPADATADGARIRELALNDEAARSFRDAPDVRHPDFDADVQWELSRLIERGLDQVVAVNLTRPDLGVPVVRVIIPGLEAMSEVPGYVLGARARRALEAVTS